MVVLLVRDRVGVRISLVVWVTLLWRETHIPKAIYVAILLYTEVKRLICFQCIFSEYNILNMGDVN